MTNIGHNGGPAFPHETYHNEPAPGAGMSLRDWFAGQALQNPEICTGHASEDYLRKWFGSQRSVSPWEIAVAQAYKIADAMLAEREKGGAE